MYGISFQIITGESKICSFLQEDQKNLKAKMREKVRPKMGKIDIDYQKLHDAFFRHQNKPKMTVHGDLYYEVWEVMFTAEIKLRLTILWLYKFAYPADVFLTSPMIR